MIEPRRLLEHGATDAERALLNSARADGPTEGAAQRMLVALEALTAGRADPSSQGSGHYLGAGPPASTHSVKLGALAKVGLVTLVGLGVVSAGAIVYLRQRSVPREASGARAPVTSEGLVAGTAEIPRERTTSGVAFEGSASPHGSEVAPRHRPPSAMDESLSAEIRVLDAARAAADAHNPLAAQRALDSYAHRFPQGHLKPEATVLHLAVLVQQGHRTAARSLAAQLLAGESYKAYEYRIRSLLRQLGD